MDKQVLINDVVEEDLDDSQGAPIAPDIDPDQWITRDDSNVVGKVFIKGLGNMKVAALTHAESATLRKGAYGPPDRSGHRKLNTSLLVRLVIAKSISKAHPGRTFLPEQLNGKLEGDLIAVQKQIYALSGFDAEDLQPAANEVFD